MQLNLYMNNRKKQSKKKKYNEDTLLTESPSLKHMNMILLGNDLYIKINKISNTIANYV